MPSTKVRIYQDALKSIEVVLLLTDKEDWSKEELINNLEEVLVKVSDRISFAEEQQEMFYGNVGTLRNEPIEVSYPLMGDDFEVPF